MDFVGNLNFVNPTTQAEGSPVQQRDFFESRMNRPTLIRDARLTQGVMSEPHDATEMLTNGSGFLLVHSPSTVQDWTDIREVADIYYAETRKLLQRLLPTAVVPPTSSHTYRNEQFKEHFWENGVQYGPCATGVHNDYADFIDEDTGKVIEKFSEVQGMPQDKRYLGFNIWRSVSPSPLERFPLAVCDRTSIDPGDLEYNLNPNAKPRPFNAHYCKPNDGQRWNYFSAMTKDEALVFTTYDSHPPNNDIFCPTLHTAVPIPGSDGLQERNSVEVRFFVQLASIVK
ncbi:MAG: CmcJ/NvfI family oxidoreductase [Gammaproteobacteria bacterium]|nr:CmcJ/NvfI family oxidoreductase [Gammaproteobacteria bacterium]